MNQPLAEKLRPKSFQDVIGQDHLTGNQGWLLRTIEKKQPLSILLWGPPGTGKTSIAQLYAVAFDALFLPVSAVLQGVSDLKKTVKELQEKPLFKKRVIVFIDEIHRLNKAQQDVLLPWVEKSEIILIGATTENPSFSLNAALLSRLRVLQLHALNENSLIQLLERFECNHQKLPLTDDAKKALAALAQGDGRHFINMIENLLHAPSEPLIDTDQLVHWVQKRLPLYDKADDGHYNLISALHKSVRGSDPNASLYWLARMLNAGEDPEFIARRVVRMATEDIGLADPEALNIALSAWRAFDQLGSPEGELALAQAVVYMALAPKSNAIYVAYQKAMELAKNTAHLSPPKIILNAPTKWMKNQGYGKDYLYDHDTEKGFSGQNYFPDEIPRGNFYEPKEYGFEREMKKRLEYFNKLRQV